MTNTETQIFNAFATLYPEEADHTDGIIVSRWNDGYCVDLEGIPEWKSDGVITNNIMTFSEVTSTSNPLVSRQIFVTIL
jgi:hypothetical protein